MENPTNNVDYRREFCWCWIINAMQIDERRARVFSILRDEKIIRNEHFIQRWNIDGIRRRCKRAFFSFCNGASYQSLHLFNCERQTGRTELPFSLVRWIHFLLWIWHTHQKVSSSFEGSFRLKFNSHSSIIHTLLLSLFLILTAATPMEKFSNQFSS